MARNLFDGNMHELPVDQRDRGEQWRANLGRHGHTLACCTVHIPGVTDRDVMVGAVHKMIESKPQEANAKPLCGVRHVEDIGIWQTPHTGRAELRREVARLGAQHRRPVVLVQGFQHFGPCPAVTS